PARSPRTVSAPMSASLAAARRSPPSSPPPAPRSCSTGRCGWSRWRSPPPCREPGRTGARSRAVPGRAAPGATTGAGDRLSREAVAPEAVALPRACCLSLLRSKAPMAETRLPRPVVLCILDGWGVSDRREDNAIAQARTPNWDGFMRDCPHALIDASELHVGLPEGQMGNSEVGHMNIGAGRVVLQDLPRIDAALRSGALESNPRLREFIERLRASGGTCHLMGLMSPGGVHSHQDHIAALARI